MQPFNCCKWWLAQVFFQQPYCVFVSGSHNVSVVHNDISKVPYSGIRIWAYDVDPAPFDAGVATFNVSYNHVRSWWLSFTFSLPVTGAFVLAEVRT